MKNAEICTHVISRYSWSASFLRLVHLRHLHLRHSYLRHFYLSLRFPVILLFLVPPKSVFNSWNMRKRRQLTVNDHRPIIDLDLYLDSLYSDFHPKRLRSMKMPTLFVRCIQFVFSQKLLLHQCSMTYLFPAICPMRTKCDGNQVVWYLWFHY